MDGAHDAHDHERAQHKENVVEAETHHEGESEVDFLHVLDTPIDHLSTWSSVEKGHRSSQDVVHYVLEGLETGSGNSASKETRP